MESLSLQVKSAVRDQVYSVLAHYASTTGNHKPVWVKQVFLMTADGLVETGVIDRPEFLGGSGAGGQKFTQFIRDEQPKLFPNYEIPLSIVSLIRQTIWELYTQGVLAPAPKEDKSNSHSHNCTWMTLDTFVFTPYGVKLLLDSKNRICVYDPDGYLANFLNAEPAPDPEMMRYLSECVSVFRGNHLLASVVLLGVASERLIDVLAKSLKDALGNEVGSSWYGRYRKKDISAKFSSISNKLKDKFETFDLNTDAFRAVELTFQYIRLARNDIAHPKDRHFTSNEVGGFIHNFVQYFKYINNIIAFLAENPKTS